MIRYCAYNGGILTLFIWKLNLCRSVWEKCKTYIGDRSLIRKEILWSNGMGYIKN